MRPSIFALSLVVSSGCSASRTARVGVASTATSTSAPAAPSAEPSRATPVDSPSPGAATTGAPHVTGVPDAPRAAVAPPVAAAPVDCPDGSLVRRWDFAAGERAFARVRIGWTTGAVRRALGDPEHCRGAVWTYTAGLSDGPLLTYSFTITRGRVSAIEHGAAACILREFAE